MSEPTPMKLRPQIGDIISWTEDDGKSYEGVLHSVSANGYRILENTRRPKLPGASEVQFTLPVAPSPLLDDVRPTASEFSLLVALLERWGSQAIAAGCAPLRAHLLRDAIEAVNLVKVVGIVENWDIEKLGSEMDAMTVRWAHRLRAVQNLCPIYFREFQELVSELRAAITETRKLNALHFDTEPTAVSLGDVRPTNPMPREEEPPCHFVSCPVCGSLLPALDSIHPIQTCGKCQAEADSGRNPFTRRRLS